MIMMSNQNKLKRFEIDNLTKKGYRAYVIENRDLNMLSKMLYYRFFLDNFYIGKVLFIKNRKED